MELFELSAEGKRRALDQLPWGNADTLGTEAVTTKLRALRWVSSEPASDLGHLSHTPAGALLLRLMERRLRVLVNALTGAAEIATPLVFRADAPGVLAEAGRFFGEMYHAGAHQKPASLVMRPGGDFGAFSMAARMDFRCESLPWRVFECGPVFRRLQRGQIRGLSTLRAFSLLDYHAICADIDQLWDETCFLISAQRDAITALGFSGQLVLEVERAFLDKHEARFHALLDVLGCSAFVVLLPERSNYWLCQHRFHDASGGGLMDGQMDLENGRNYSIRFKDMDGAEKFASICHGSWGSVERWLWRTIGSALRSATPALPQWLAPVQLRFLPCSDAGNAAAQDFLERLRHRRIRVDIDRRDKNISSRIRLAFEEFVHTVAVVDDREAAVGGDVLPFRRADGLSFVSSLGILADAAGR